MIRGQKIQVRLRHAQQQDSGRPKVVMNEDDIIRIYYTRELATRFWTWSGRLLLALVLTLFVPRPMIVAGIIIGTAMLFFCSSLYLRFSVRRAPSIIYWAGVFEITLRSDDFIGINVHHPSRWVYSGWP